MVHLLFHFLIPAVVVMAFYRHNWKPAYFVMIATMAVDLDHLVATPIYDPNRCSIGFHPFHQLWFVALYLAMCFHSKTRLVGLGLIIHMALDSVDCQLTNGVWFY